QEGGGSVKRKSDRRIKFLFWNISGMGKKDKEFWSFINNFDVVGLVETWMEEKSWKKFETNLPKMFRWKYQPAIREKKRGRAKGGILTGVSSDIMEYDVTNEEKDVVERRIN